MPSRRRRTDPPPAVPPAKADDGPARPPDQAGALAKLKSLLDSGVLTREQYESELQRLTEGG
jgi:putative oligomerization/nucleic acid binding protein